MFKNLLAATFAILFAGSSALAQYGRGYGGYGRGYSGLPGNRDIGYGSAGYGSYGGNYYYGGSSYYPNYGSYSYYPTYETNTYYGGVLAPYSTYSRVEAIPYASVYPPAGSSGALSPVAPAGNSNSIAPPASPPATMSPSTASIAVVVPKGGHVWFNGSMNPPSDNSSKWTFTTQKLDPGKTYVLEIKTTFNDQTFKVPLRVQAGDNMTVRMDQIQ